MFRSIRAGLTRPSYLRSTLRRGFVTTTSPTDNKHAVPQRGMSKKGGRDRRGNRITSTSTDEGEEEEEEKEEKGKSKSPGVSEGVGVSAGAGDVDGADDGSSSSSQEKEVTGGGGAAEGEGGEGETTPFPDEYERLTTQDSRKEIRSPKRIRKRKPARSSSFNQTNFNDSELIDPIERRLNQDNPEGILNVDVDARMEREERVERVEREEGEVVVAAAAAAAATPTPHTAHLTEYPPMPTHSNERMVGLPEDDYDLDNPWGKLFFFLISFYFLFLFFSFMYH